jgi:hypothetical protein
MGKLTRSAGRVLGAGIVVLTAAGIVVLAGAGIANARPAGTSTSTSTSACDKIFATFNTLNVMQTKHPHTWGPAIAAAAAFPQDASTGSPAVKSAVSIFVADLQVDIAARHVSNRPKLLADANAIVVACSAQPSGAPATGGGSTAGVEDTALFGVGGAVVLAGIGVLGLAWRNRPRGSLGHG